MYQDDTDWFQQKWDPRDKDGHKMQLAPIFKNIGREFWIHKPKDSKILSKKQGRQHLKNYTMRLSALKNTGICHKKSFRFIKILESQGTQQKFLVTWLYGQSLIPTPLFLLSSTTFSFLS